MRARYAALLILLTTCSSGPTEPSTDAVRLRVGDSIVRLELSASSTALRPGTPLTLRATLTNDGPSSVVLHFNNSCQILPYIHDANDTIVLPHGGGWVCFAALTQLSLARGQRVRQEFVWTGSTSFSSEMPLRPLPDGTYFASILVPAQEGMLRTPPLPIRLTGKAP